MMTWTHLIYISKIFIESLNPMDQDKMRLQENKDAGDILKGSTTVFAKLHMQLKTQANMYFCIFGK